MTPLPLPRPGSGTYRIALVCLGNICRSPMADVVLREKFDAAGLPGRVEVSSSGTGGWHVGRPMDPRAAATLSAAGYDPSAHRARQFDPADLADLDLVLAMDTQNLRDITGDSNGPDRDRVRLFRDFDPHGRGGEVPDPYYGGDAGFEEVLAMVERTAAAIVALVSDQLRAQL